MSLEQRSEVLKSLLACSQNPQQLAFVVESKPARKGGKEEIEAITYASRRDHTVFEDTF
jgi:hypothetical protein